jgi:predicted AlkP superfamily pyrophosphatase or phosphodiesterase
MKRQISLLAAMLLLLSRFVCAAEPTTRPVAAITHAVVISVDGLRPDVLLRSNTPNMHHMMDEGSYTFWARTVAESITLPSHTSMLTGVTVQRHGVTWNDPLPAGEPQKYPLVPTIFELMKQAGYTTAMAAGKSKFVALAKPGSIDWMFIPAQTTITDDVVAEHAEQLIHEHRPDFLFVHFPNVDNVGHARGWGTRDQRAAAAQADIAVGRVLAAIDKEGLTGSTFVLLTADHGGAGRNHGPDDPRSRHIPWIAMGPGIFHDLDLTINPHLVINTEDTFATVCYLMGVAVDRSIDGKPIMEIVQRDELLHPTN